VRNAGSEAGSGGSWPDELVELEQIITDQEDAAYEFLSASTRESLRAATVSIPLDGASDPAGGFVNGDK
jgi:hypothetical protein